MNRELNRLRLNYEHKKLATAQAASTAFYVFLFGTVAVALLMTMPLLLQLLFLTAGAAYGATVLRRKPPTIDGADHLVGCFYTAGIFRATRVDVPAPTLTLPERGWKVADEHGTTMLVQLPFGMTLTNVQNRHDELASAMNVAPAQLLLSTPDGAPANTVRIFVARPAGAHEMPREAMVARAARTSWYEPIRLGIEPDGAQVNLTTREANTIISGIPGSGKTSIARMVAGHALLDPGARVMLVDGKGSVDDWGAAAQLCDAFILGSADDALEQVEQVLNQTLATVQERNGAQGDGKLWAPIVLILEEFQDIRAAADKKTGERIDTTLGRVVRQGRAVGVHVIIVTQRPSVDDVPSSVRNLLSTRMILMTRNAADAQLVLGETPTLPLPTRRGEALVATPVGTVAARLDHLTDEAWVDVCARAAQLRAYA